MTQRFDRAVQALVSAYLNDTLAKSFCSACAVGNICAAGMGIKVIKNSFGFPAWDKADIAWHHVFMTDNKTNTQTQWPEDYDGLAKQQIDSTGYSWQELARIELAFEKATKIDGTEYKYFKAEQVDADQLSGLYAVIDVLCDVEGITDAGPTKALFAKPVLAEADA